MKDAKGHGSNPRGARAEKIAMGKAVDARRADLAPPMTITDRMAAMSLGQGHPKSYISPLGSSFAAAQDQLDRARNLALPRGTPGRRKS